MKEFVFHNPTKIIFGNDSTAKFGEHAKDLGKKALFVYGQNSIKKSGLYDEIVRQLNEHNISFIEHEGVKSNPTLEHTRDGVKKVLENGIDFIVAIGGGSVLDEAKAIAASSASKVDAWDIFTQKEKITKALPLITVLTLPATGSEMNGNMVITNTETKEKFGLGNPLLYPRVSILNPVLTNTIPLKNTAYSVVDIVSHLTESYFNNEGGDTSLQERYVQGLSKTIIEASYKVMKNPEDNEGRATIMWGATLGWNGLNTAGIGHFSMPCHMLEHPLSAIYDIAHGAGLSIVTPAWLSNHVETKTKKIAQFGREVFGVEEKDDKKAAISGIEKLKAWYKDIGAPTSFNEAGISNPDVDFIVKLVMESVRLRGTKGLDEPLIRKIYQDCL
ncbi:MAG: iron-containing alcohol dehydrogenase [Alphaproteobacteria bacterium]